MFKDLEEEIGKLLFKKIIICYSFIIYAGSNEINHESEDWTDFIDRGGLIHINDTLYCTLWRWR